MRKTIVGIDAHVLGDKSGGNERHYRNFLDAMKVPSSFDIKLFVEPGVDVGSYGSKFEIIRFKSKNPFIRNFFELNVLCKKYKIDVLHTQYFIPFFCPAKIVCTIHDICFEHFNDIFTFPEYIRQKLLIPYAANNSNLIFTVSEFSKNDISETYNITKDKIVVVQGGANIFFTKINIDDIKSKRIRDKFNITSDRFILTVGNLQPRKNLNRLIDAFCLLKNEIEYGLQFVIVGKKAWMYDSIISNALRKSDDIILTDYISDEELLLLYNMTDLFVYPSIFEGFGFPPLEALRCGAKVAVSNTSSIPEAVGNAGLYFDPFDIYDIKEKIKIGLSSQFQVNENDRKLQLDKYSWEKAAEVILESYDLIAKT